MSNELWQELGDTDACYVSYLKRRSSRVRKRRGVAREMLKLLTLFVLTCERDHFTKFEGSVKQNIL